MAAEDTYSTQDSSSFASSDEDHVEKFGTCHSSHCSDNRLDYDINSRNMNAETFGRSPDLESGRLSLFPMISYVSQIGGEGGPIPGEDVNVSTEKDPNLVEWDGPSDPVNPYNWYVLAYSKPMIGPQSTSGG